MGHKDKTLFLSDSDKPKVFRPAGQVEATVLSKGVISGTWRTERIGKVLAFKIAPFNAFSSAEMKAIQKEAGIVAKSLGFAQTTIDVQAAS